MNIEETINDFKLQIETLLGSRIGLLIFPDGNTTKASIVLPVPEYGYDYPPSGTTLQDNKLGVALRVNPQPVSTFFDSIDMICNVSIYSNNNMSILLDALRIIESSNLSILGESKIKTGQLDPIAKNFLFFDLIFSIRTTQP
jgi:hypothetical protein